MAVVSVENATSIVAIASNSPRRIAATSQLVTPGAIEYLSGGSEDENLSVHQIARDKVAFALSSFSRLYPRRTGIVLAADVKVAPMMANGLELQSKLTDETAAIDVIQGMIQAAKRYNQKPYYIINAGFARWEGEFGLPQRSPIETRTEYASVSLDLEKLERLTTSNGFQEYKQAVAYTELSPLDDNITTRIADISGGLSLAALVYLGVADSLTVGREQISFPDKIDKTHSSFIDAFKRVYFMQAVGFSPELLNKRSRRNIPYSSIEDAIKNWAWLNEITRRVFQYS